MVGRSVFYTHPNSGSNDCIRRVAFPVTGRGHDPSSRTSGLITQGPHQGFPRDGQRPRSSSSRLHSRWRSDQSVGPSAGSPIQSTPVTGRLQPSDPDHHHLSLLLSKSEPPALPIYYPTRFSSGTLSGSSSLPQPDRPEVLSLHTEPARNFYPQVR